MADNIYDIGIVGAGVGGAFAALRLAEKHNAKTILFDLGRPPGKRRRPLEGWFGCFPTGDGKVYSDDIDDVLEVTDGRRAKAINKWVKKHLAEIHPGKIVKSKKPSNVILNKFKDAGFEFRKRDYVQWKPDSIHLLARSVAEQIEDGKNVDFSFDNEVFTIIKKNGCFHISSEGGEFICKKIILAVGRSGWRWVNKLYRDFGILTNDNYARYGIFIELPAQYLRNFNKSHCIFKRDDVTIGPMSWGGSIIQEDHANMTTAAFRSNEDRWKTDKVFFSVIGNRYIEDCGCAETDRLSKLSFLLFEDRVGREKVKDFLNGQSQLNLIEEFNWFSDIFKELDTYIPNLIKRGYYHSPAFNPLMNQIRIGSNLETEVEGFFVIGECANQMGIASAAITGGIAAESCVK